MELLFELKLELIHNNTHKHNQTENKRQCAGVESKYRESEPGNPSSWCNIVVSTKL